MFHHHHQAQMEGCVQFSVPLSQSSGDGHFPPPACERRPRGVFFFGLDLTKLGHFRRATGLYRVKEQFGLDRGWLNNNRRVCFRRWLLGCEQFLSWRHRLSSRFFQAFKCACTRARSWAVSLSSAGLAGGAAGAAVSTGSAPGVSASGRGMPPRCGAAGARLRLTST